METRFDGKIALVTGAGKGIGKAVAIRLTECGAKVIAVSRTQSDLDELSKISPKIQPLCLDIGDWKKTKAALQNIGPIDLLVNNAGVGLPTTFGDISEEVVDVLFNINVKAVINITQEISNKMKERGKGGAIVNVSSLGAMKAFPGYSCYTTTKGALDQLTRSMAAEFGPHNIRVNSVNPTIIRTKMSEAIREHEAATEAVIARTPLRRLGEVDDVAYPILFLLSDKASMITGATLPIDGGIHVVF